MRRASPFSAQRRELEIKMTPMIDVVFLLLVFFIWTSSFRIAESVLPSQLTAVAGAAAGTADQLPTPEQDFDQVVVRILWTDGQPTWRINELVLGDLSQVRSRLEAIARIRRDVPVILHPDPEVPLDHVIDAYDLTRLVGFQKIQFATSAPR